MTKAADSAAKTADSPTLLVLGDSLSAAYGMASELGWVALLQTRLDEKNINVKVVNRSVSGATTAAGLQILPSALNKHDPAIVIVELGANDGLQGKPLEYIRQNIERLITLCKSAGAQVLLLGMHVPPNYGDTYAKPFFEQYAEIASKHDVAYLPFFLEGIAGNPDLIMADGLHPLPKAQMAILDNVYVALSPLLKTLDTNQALER